MWPFVGALFVMFFVMGAIAILILWAIREHLTAQKYRYLVRLHHAMPKTPAHIHKVGPTWRFIYKNKKVVEEIDIEAKTEGEAIQKFMKTGRDYAKVVNFSKL